MKPSIELIRLVAVILITFTHTRNDLQSGYIFFVVEKLPTFGTAMLSIVSGYLYYSVSLKKKIFIKKIKTLLIPYLIANISVIIIVFSTILLLDYNPLNRLSLDSSLILE
jgi:fucose 4-O-acetylase-like acetyltransferase